MIPVQGQSEPPDFDEQVRQPGRRRRAARQAEGNEDWPDTWRECLDDLWAAYHGTCAYLAVRIRRAVAAPTVDHYHPKSRYPEQAYEWANYRLASPRMNTRKGDHEDVVDPFEVEDGWFQIDNFVSMEIVPGPNLALDVSERVETTIRRLKLNDVLCVRDRLVDWEDYWAGNITLAHLTRESPFVAREAARHGLLRLGDAVPPRVTDADLT